MTEDVADPPGAASGSASSDGTGDAGSQDSSRSSLASPASDQSTSTSVFASSSDVDVGGAQNTSSRPASAASSRADDRVQSASSTKGSSRWTVRAPASGGSRPPSATSAASAGLAFVSPPRPPSRPASGSPHGTAPTTPSFPSLPAVVAATKAAASAEPPDLPPDSLARTLPGDQSTFANLHTAAAAQAPDVLISVVTRTEDATASPPGGPEQDVAEPMYTDQYLGIRKVRGEGPSTLPPVFPTFLAALYAYAGLLSGCIMWCWGLRAGTTPSDLPGDGGDDDCINVSPENMSVEVLMDLGDKADIDLVPLNIDSPLYELSIRVIPDDDLSARSRSTAMTASPRFTARRSDRSRQTTLTFASSAQPPGLSSGPSMCSPPSPGSTHEPLGQTTADGGEGNSAQIMSPNDGSMQDPAFFTPFPFPARAAPCTTDTDYIAPPSPRSLMDDSYFYPGGPGPPKGWRPWVTPIHSALSASSLLKGEAAMLAQAVSNMQIHLKDREGKLLHDMAHSASSNALTTPPMPLPVCPRCGATLGHGVLTHLSPASPPCPKHSDSVGAAPPAPEEAATGLSASVGSAATLPSAAVQAICCNCNTPASTETSLQSWLLCPEQTCVYAVCGLCALAIKPPPFAMMRALEALVVLEQGGRHGVSLQEVQARLCLLESASEQPLSLPALGGTLSPPQLAPQAVQAGCKLEAEEEISRDQVEELEWSVWQRMALAFRQSAAVASHLESRRALTRRIKEVEAHLEYTTVFSQAAAQSFVGRLDPTYPPWPTAGFDLAAPGIMLSRSLPLRRPPSVGGLSPLHKMLDSSWKASPRPPSLRPLESSCGSCFLPPLDQVQGYDVSPCRTKAALVQLQSRSVGSQNSSVFTHPATALGTISKTTASATSATVTPRSLAGVYISGNAKPHLCSLTGK
eukprot:gene10051-1813_t